MTNAAVVTEPKNRYSANPLRSHPMLWWGIGLIALAVIFGLLVAIDPANPFCQGFDQAWRDLVGGNPGDQNLLPVRMLDAAGRPPGALFVMLIPAVILFACRHWRSGLYVLAVMAGGGLVVQLVKKTVERPRPTNPLVDPSLLDHGSFPSGHAAQAAMLTVAVAAVLIPLWRKWWWILGGIFTLATVWQRTFVGAHWFTDTLAGVAIGTGAALILWWAFYPLIRRDWASRPPAAAEPSPPVSASQAA